MKSRLQPLLSGDTRPMPVPLHRPSHMIDDVGVSFTIPPPATWDPAIDRWVNEGGAVREYSTHQIYECKS